MAFEHFVEDFEDIRPYTDAEMRPVLKRISHNDWLVGGVRSVLFPRCPEFLQPLVEKLVQLDLWTRLRKIETIDQFQKNIIIHRAMEYLVKKTTESVTMAGLEQLDPQKGYMYISNHRDIVLDSAFVNYSMVKTGKQIAEIAFGDNLLVNDFVSDLIRINRSFIVRRDLPLRERAKATLTLSRYIAYTMEQGNSLWLAQKEGRAKDGDDRTNPSIIKMLYFGPRREKISFDDYIARSRIVPVAVSYEYDPCDVLKAREIHRREKAGTYQKRKDEDLLSMYAGLRRWKGRVHVSFGKPLTGKFTNATQVAEKIDSVIHSIYKLWPSNYIAFDKLKGNTDHSSEYSAEDVENFTSRFRKESEEVKARVLHIYANSVKNQLFGSLA
ncbi:MAG: acyltransferase [Spirochaetales bacterium]|jgi:hypothetical protein|nr:acyltransferase [Spirochaetales bacterium]